MPRSVGRRNTASLPVGEPWAPSRVDYPLCPDHFLSVGSSVDGSDRRYSRKSGRACTVLWWTAPPFPRVLVDRSWTALDSDAHGVPDQ
jgi:hypothetical protein